MKTPEGIPYIPGSSLKGKMRSLVDRKYFDMTPLKNYQLQLSQIPPKECEEFKRQKKQELIRLGWWPIGDSFIHICNAPDCRICTVFGRPSELESATPTLLICRDVFLDTNDFEKKFPELRKDGLWTELKWENAIDRLTSAANPRDIERVPPGALFHFTFIFNVYEDAHIGYFSHVLEAMDLLEGDYIGGMGTRGSGQVIFKDLKISTKTAQDYVEGAPEKSMIEVSTLSDIRKQEADLIQKLREALQKTPQ